jgi:cyanophycinase
MFKYSRKGTLVLIGGAEDRKYEKKILNHIIRINNPGKVAVFPTASSYPGEVFETYRRAFKDIGVAEVFYADIRYRDEADRPRYLKMVDEADLIFFTGGDQERLVDVLGGSRILKRIRHKYNRGTTIAGTSAGAAAIGDPMVTSGNDTGGFKKGAIRISSGFGFLKRLVVDTHFLARGRIPRLAQMLSSGKCRQAIGLDEDTAVAVYPDRTFEVLGSSMVTVMSSYTLHYTSYHQAATDDLVGMDRIHISFLAPGMKYSLRKKRVIATDARTVRQLLLDTGKNKSGYALSYSANDDSES